MTKLVELEPHWLEWGRRKVGLMFLCPHCRVTWLSCMFEPTPLHARGPGRGVDTPNQFALFTKIIGEHHAHDVVPCNKAVAWTRTTDDFNTMSITPSLDASAAGHWHGYVKNGEIA